MCKMSTGVVALFIASLVGCGPPACPDFWWGQWRQCRPGKWRPGRQHRRQRNCWRIRWRDRYRRSRGHGEPAEPAAARAEPAGVHSSRAPRLPVWAEPTRTPIPAAVPSAARLLMLALAKDAGRADTPPVSAPIACPAIACVGGTHPNPDPCGCPLCGPAPDAGVAKDAGPPTACPMLASLNSTDAAASFVGRRDECGWSASTPDGSTEGCISNDATGCPGPAVTGDGDLVGCSDRCAANEYGLSYGGVGPSAAPPSIDLPAGCGSGQYTPGGLGFYCCPCGI